MFITRTDFPSFAFISDLTPLSPFIEKDFNTQKSKLNYGGCSVKVARSAVARADRVRFPASTFEDMESKC